MLIKLGCTAPKSWSEYSTCLFKYLNFAQIFKVSMGKFESLVDFLCRYFVVGTLWQVRFYVKAKNLIQHENKYSILQLLDEKKSSHNLRQIFECLAFYPPSFQCDAILQAVSEYQNVSAKIRQGVPDSRSGALWLYWRHLFQAGRGRPKEDPAMGPCMILALW